MFYYKLYLGFKHIVLFFLRLWPIVATKWLLWWTASWRKPVLKAVQCRSSEVTTANNKKRKNKKVQIKLTNEEKIVTTEQKPQSPEHSSTNVYQEGSMWYFYDAFIFVISDVFPFLKLISICFVCFVICRRTCQSDASNDVTSTGHLCAGAASFHYLLFMNKVINNQFSDRIYTIKSCINHLRTCLRTWRMFIWFITFTEELV